MSHALHNTGTPQRARLALRLCADANLLNKGLT